MCSCNNGMALSGMAGEPYGGEPLFTLPRGLGDICYDDIGNPIDCVGSPGQIPTESPYPVIFSGPNPTPSSPVTSGSSPLLNSLLQQWTNISGSILKSAAGANPTYQAVGPGGSVTYYGSPGALPGLPANLMSSPSGMIFGLPTSVVLIGLATIVGISMFGGGRRR